MKYDNLSSPPRQRTSVAIQGLDRSTPDDLCKDGTCQELLNLRWKDNAWRPVYEHRLKASPKMPFSTDIVYHHPVAGDNHYIVEDEEGETLFVYYDFDTTSESYTELGKFACKQNVSHFGNVLVFESAATCAYYMYKDSAYKKVTFPPYAKVRVNTLSAIAPPPSRMFAEIPNDANSLADIVEYPVTDESYNEIENKGGVVIEYQTDICDFNTGNSLLPINGEYSWRGEIMLFTTWQLEDGTNLCPSPLLLVHSAVTPSLRSYEGLYVGLHEDKILRASHTCKDNNQPFFPRNNLLSSIIPTIKINISKDWDYSAVKKLVVWATRIHPTFAPFIPTDPSEEATLKGRSWFADNELADQTFYMLKEFSLEAFVDDPDYTDPNAPESPEQDPDDGYIDDGYDPNEGWDPDYDGWDDDRGDWGAYALSAGARRASSGSLKCELQLTKPLLDAFVGKEEYEPNNNVHLLFASNPFDYNNRYHYFNYKQTFAKGYHISDSNVPNANGSLMPFNEWVELEVDNKTYDIVSSSKKVGTYDDNVLAEGTPFCNVISYPDVRAKRFSVESHFRVSLKPAYNNGFAWYCEPPTSISKFPPIALDGGILSGDELPEDNSVAFFNNRIQATSSNNLFSIPFDNNYVIGSRNNRIIALQSAAIENSDEKIGEHPLYVFTEEGIFALRAGSETLYARVDAINYDKIINPNTLAINGGIVYITEKGVHLLSNAGSTVISTPIHDTNGMPPLDFLRTCKILWPKQYNEIVLYNEDNNRAYVFNLDSAYWSTRQMQGRKINTDELIYGQSIYDLSDEDENRAMPCTIETRPIKLGNVEFKRLETIVPHMATNNHPALIDLEVTGSVDGSAYSQLRMVQAESIDANKINPLVLRRTPFSAKYFKVMLDMDATPDETTYNTSITHIDFEWYQRFMSRMR